MDIVLRSDPGSSELSRAEENLIDRIFKEDGLKDRFQLRDESHENYPEWRDPNSSSRPISIEDILRAVGADEDEQNHTADAISIQKLSLCCRTNS